MRGINENLLARIQKLEREVERLKVKESPIMSNYLLATGKAADSDKLDGQLASYYALATHDHDGVYIPLTNFAWQDWTPTVTGWAAGYTVKLARYMVIGKTCFFAVDISGTSNSTAVNIALPHNSATGNFDGYWGGSCAFLQDNGTVATAPGRWYVAEDSATLIANTNMSTGTWTSSGAKRVIVTGFYEIA